MVFKQGSRKAFYVFLALTGLFFLGSLYVYLDFYYLSNYRTINSARDQRWRVVNFNSRQASEGEIYSVAEELSLKSTRFVARRKLRFEFFTPGPVSSWRVLSTSDGKVVSEGKYPEIQFPEKHLRDTFIFVPEGLDLAEEIAIELEFTPTELYRENGLNWPDNYWIPTMNLPVSFKQPYSVQEWVGLPDDDPELVEARRLLGSTVDGNAPTLLKLEQVFRFIQQRMGGSRGTPSKEVQDSSPLETYEYLSSGKGKGWCEQVALGYYLFANAAGVETRLVDICGRVGEVELVGHYFCESWVPEYSSWCYVDPQSYIAYIEDSREGLVNTVELNRLTELDGLGKYRAVIYDRENDSLLRLDGDDLMKHLKRTGYNKIFDGEFVIGYKFGYANTKSYPRLKNFLCYTTLLYAPFSLPKLYLVKFFFLAGFALSLAVTILLGFCIVALPEV